MSQSPDSPQRRTTIKDPRQAKYVDAWTQVNQLLRHGRSFSGRERNKCFLNVGNGRFADVSAVAGFDYSDDGRGLAVCDWDRDGDLDVWTTNRNAPRLRFLKNDATEANDYLQFRLQGTSGNRDAVGARVRIQLHTTAGPSLVMRSVRAGEGFLSQSSKWVHVGLGDNSRINHITVRWPDGLSESFVAPTAKNQRYLLVQGSGRCQPIETGGLPHIAPRQVTSVLSETERGATTHNLLTAPFPLPPLEYELRNGQIGDFANGGGRPVLLNLSATWCPNCVAELNEWKANARQLESNMEVITLVVDRLDTNEASHPPSAESAMELRPPFQLGDATTDLVDRLQQVLNAIYDHESPFPVPTSFLIDRDGRLAAIYKGPVSVERVLADVQILRSDNVDRLDRALPMPGRWIAIPGGHDLQKLGRQMVASGHADDVVAFAERLTDSEQRLRQQVELRMLAANSFQDHERYDEAVEQYDHVIRLAPASATSGTLATAMMKKGICLSKLDRTVEAAEILAEAVTSDGGVSAEAFVNYGVVLRKIGDVDNATQQLTRAIELDPNLAQAHASLGLAFASQQKYEPAAKALARAVDLEPENVKTRINLALALEQIGQTNNALSQLEEVMRLEPDSVVAIVYAAEFLAKRRRFPEAIEYAQRAVNQKPRAAKLRFRLASLHELAGNDVAALAEYREAERLVRGDPVVQACIAWLLATSADESVRDSAEAVRLSSRAARTSRRQDATILKVLASAYAAADDFEKAANVAREAIEVATKQRNVDLVREVRQQLRRYESRQPIQDGAHDAKAK